jgi:hypothetical protein
VFSTSGCVNTRGETVDFTVHGTFNRPMEVVDCLPGKAFGSTGRARRKSG